LGGITQTKHFQVSDVDPIQTPTPATLWLLGPGLIGMGWLSRRWRRKAA
jgi:hypothetical protein